MSKYFSLLWGCGFVSVCVGELLLGGKVSISKLGIGTWAWGDKFYWNYESGQDASLKEVFDYCVKEGGVNFFDTAEVYGLGRSELLCGRFRRQLLADDNKENVVLASKFAPLPFRLGSNCVVSACQDSLDRMGIEKMGLYQLHWPALFQNEAYWDGIAKCYERGLIESVGVSNYGQNQLRTVHKFLADRGIPLATNQIQYSLLSRQADNNGLKRAAQELNVTLLAYSPLAQGILTGKFDATNLPRGPRSAVVRTTLPRVKGLLDALKDIAVSKSESQNLDVSMSQVALNWCIAKGTVPIPGARSLKQAVDNCATLKWTLDDAEVKILDDKASASGVNVPAPLEGR